MDELWVEKHRPRCVDDIQGQPSVVSRLRAYVKNGTFPGKKHSISVDKTELDQFKKLISNKNYN